MFPRFQEFSPLFRLLDDYDRASRQSGGIPNGLPSSLRTFQPKFDVKEVKDAYELHGELPGIEQKNIEIEWTDGNTLTISGRTEHRSEKGERPAGFVTEGGEQNGGAQSQHEYQKPSVEDEAEAKGKGTQVAKTGGSKEVSRPSEEAKYWVSERSVGEFHRSFSFPTRVDQDNVRASLKDGILSIVVPKAQAPKARKIAIE
ncbi:HSP20-like chaperone [Saccharata proteae CBS 121410]|uniref:HSP20-like chaperone n=1 Tax=Saccharata proteae CBS 121410 TaxID=1314787 RepID=A0A9P4M289_9PEZI|nr:HSP20-like chaperone [Saccharata proteae CBS 121410]